MHTSSLVEPTSFLGTFKFEFAPAGEMEFLNSNGETENISLQDMIECDIRSEFNDQICKLDGTDSQTSLLDTCNLNFHENSQVSMATINDTSSKLSGDFNWLQGININTIQQLDQPENTDPNLLVNPSTGLPVSLCSLVTCTQDSPSPTNTTAAAVTLVGPADQTTVMSKPTVQYIGIPTASVRNHNCIQSPIIQHIQQHQQIDTQFPQPPALDLQQVEQQSQNDNCKTVGQCNENSKVYPKPVYSYSCLIAMALKNSENGCLPVSEIYSFMTENFPYFKTAPDGWKNSVRHNLSLNKCFEKIENPKSNGTTKKGCLWAMNPAKIEKMEDEIAKWRKKDPVAIHKSMAKPERLDSLEKGHQTPKKNTERHVETIKIEKITKIEENANTIKSVDLNELFNGEVSPEDIQMLENSLHMDPTLSDLAVQNGLLDELNNDVFGVSANLEEMSTANQTLSNSFTMSSAIVSQLIAPVTLHSPAGSPMKTDSSKLQTPYLYSPSYSRLDNKTTRTVSALT